MFGQLQGTGLASQTYDFRLHFWDRFLGSFLNASSSKVTTSRAEPRAEFWSHGNSTFWEPQCRPQSFRLFVGLGCAPILATRFASLFEFLFQSRSADPNAHSGQSIMKLAWCPESGPANWTENLNKKLLNGRRWLCPAPLNDCTHRLDAHLDYNAKGQ